MILVGAREHRKHADIIYAYTLYKMMKQPINMISMLIEGPQHKYRSTNRSVRINSIFKMYIWSVKILWILADLLFGKLIVFKCCLIGVQKLNINDLSIYECNISLI